MLLLAIIMFGFGATIGYMAGYSEGRDRYTDDRLKQIADKLDELNKDDLDDDLAQAMNDLRPD